MYVIDIKHFLNDTGEIAPERGPARKLAEFITAVIAHESDFDREDCPGPRCFKCKKSPVDTMIDASDLILWRCARCSTEGSITGWQDTFWDLGIGAPPH